MWDKIFNHIPAELKDWLFKFKYAFTMPVALGIHLSNRLDMP